MAHIVMAEPTWLGSYVHGICRPPWSMKAMILKAENCVRYGFKTCPCACLYALGNLRRSCVCMHPNRSFEIRVQTTVVCLASKRGEKDKGLTAPGLDEDLTDRNCLKMLPTDAMCGIMA